MAKPDRLSDIKNYSKDLRLTYINRNINELID